MAIWIRSTCGDEKEKYLFWFIVWFYFVLDMNFC